MHKLNLYLFLTATVLMLFPAFAFADLTYIDPLTGRNVMDQVVDQFVNQAKTWKTVMEAAATRLFWSLVLISMVWTFGMMLMRRADIGEFFAEFTRFIIFTGLFFWLLTNAVSGHNIAGTIINSMQILGNQASGLTGTAHGNIVNVAFEIWLKLRTSLSFSEPVDSMLAIILTIIIVIILTIIAVNMLFLLVSAWVLLYAGIFYLGFGGARWTSDIAINYFRTVLSVGIQLLAMTLIIGIGSAFLTSYFGKMNQNILNIEELIVMLMFAVAFYVLTSKIPPMLASIVTGGGFNSSGVSNYTGGQMMASTATSMAVMSMGIGKIADGVTSIKSLMSGGSGVNNAMDAVNRAQSLPVDYNFTKNSSRVPDEQNPLKTVPKDYHGY